MLHDMSEQETSRLGISRSVWALGFVSLFMDTSSELIHALLPVYLVTVLGASMATVGVIEGIAEGTAACTKLLSGALSDWLKKRKVLVVAGYGIAAVTKPVFALAPSIGWIFAARFLDRVGKGIRGAPRDALVADLTPPGLRGAAYGLRQSLDTIGAFLGPLLAIVLMWLMAENIRGVFAFAVVPALVAVLVLVVFVREPDQRAAAAQRPARLRGAEIRMLGGRYWRVIAIAAVFSLARFSDAFLILKAQESGLSIALVPLVLVLMNIMYALAAYPAGVLSDRRGSGGVLAVGLGFLVLGNVTLALSSTLLAAAVGIALWGLHMGFTQGIIASLVADTAPEKLRGTAFGILNLVTGIALLVASVLAGALWDIVGSAGAFIAGAVFAALSAGAVIWGHLASRPND
jgi:MFS family permease